MSGPQLQPSLIRAIVEHRVKRDNVAITLSYIALGFGLLALISLLASVALPIVGICGLIGVMLPGVSAIALILGCFLPVAILVPLGIYCWKTANRIEDEANRFLSD